MQGKLTIDYGGGNAKTVEFSDFETLHCMLRTLEAGVGIVVKCLKEREEIRRVELQNGAGI